MTDAAGSRTLLIYGRQADGACFMATIDLAVDKASQAVVWRTRKAWRIIQYSLLSERDSSNHRNRCKQCRC